MTRLRLIAWLAAVALAAVPTAAASEERPTLSELEREVVCPTCNTTLEMSRSPIADRMRGFIRRRIAAGDTETEIKEALVAEFGEEVLAAPPRRGFNLLAWLLPLGGGALAIVVLGLLARRWATARADGANGPALNGRSAIDPALERRLDEELARFEA